MQSIVQAREAESEKVRVALQQQGAAKRTANTFQAASEDTAPSAAGRPQTKRHCAEAELSERSIHRTGATTTPAQTERQLKPNVAEKTSTIADPVAQSRSVPHTRTSPGASIRSRTRSSSPCAPPSSCVTAGDGDHACGVSGSWQSV